MATIIQQVIFLIALGAASFLITKRVRRIAANIKLGRSANIKGDSSKRIQKMILIAFGQQKMFDRPLVGIMHFIIYAGFLLINIEVLEIVLDGITGQHRIFAPFLGASFYGFLISFFELLAIGVLLSCVIFLIRRNVLKLPRFWQPEMKGWPALDGNLILVSEIVLMIAVLAMNASDSILQDRGVEHYIQTGSFFFSGFFVPALSGLGDTALIIIERFGWWFHILGIMAFSLYVTYSKHLHIALAFPNTYYSNLEPFGKFKNMDAVTAEVKIAMGLMDESEASEEEVSFGADDIQKLTWKNLMDAYSCTECGRCTSECPANQTGKKLSPRKIMMDTRDRMEEIGANIQTGKTLEESLEMGTKLYSEEYISKEEIMACTTCNACVQACPVNISPLDIILQVRQYISMEEADTPASWNAMFSNIENNMAPWKYAQSDRFNWVEQLNEKA